MKNGCDCAVIVSSPREHFSLRYCKRLKAEYAHARDENADELAREFPNQLAPLARGTPSGSIGAHQR
jgi:hypothetical protein